MLRRFDIGRLKTVIADMKARALLAGRYGPPYTGLAYDTRNRSIAFRCILYNDLCREIASLERIRAFVQMAR